MTESRLRSALHYRLHDFGVGLLIYFAIIMAVFLILAILSGTVLHGEGGQFGIEFTTMITLFVFGIVCIREDLRLFCQFGVTRRSTFFAELLSAVLLSLAAGIVGLLVSWLGELIFRFAGMFHATASLFQLEFGIAGNAFALPFGQLLLSCCYNAGNYLAAFLLGMLISLLYYRMNKFFTIVFSIAGGGLLLFGLPLLAQNAMQPLAAAALRLFAWIAAAPGNHILFTLILSALFAIPSYFLLRRAPIQ